VPVAWLLAVHFDYGLAGVYAGFLAGWAVRATVTWLRYRTGRWATATRPRTG
jgi:Na+-driven multidrug efflux pump